MFQHLQSRAHRELLRRVLILALCVVALLGYALFAGAATAVPAIGVLRLHVIAHSDGTADQAVKLQVRDAVLSYIQENLGDARGEAQVQSFVAGHLGDLQAVADAALAQSGMAYGSRASLGVFDFPDKTYGNLLYPAGAYRALRVELGDAAGRNWWCVIFPPLCLTAPVASRAPEDQPGVVRYTSWLARLFGEA